MLGFAQKRGETGAGVESRETAPVDRAATMDQHRRLQVTKERVVFDSPAIAHARSVPRGCSIADATSSHSEQPTISSSTAYVRGEMTVYTSSSLALVLTYGSCCALTSDGLAWGRRTFRGRSVDRGGVATSRKRPVPSRAASHARRRTPERRVRRSAGEPPVMVARQRLGQLLEARVVANDQRGIDLVQDAAHEGEQDIQASVVDARLHGQGSGEDMAVATISAVCRARVASEVIIASGVPVRLWM